MCMHPCMFLCLQAHISACACICGLSGKGMVSMKLPGEYINQCIHMVMSLFSTTA